MSISGELSKVCIRGSRLVLSSVGMEDDDNIGCGAESEELTLAEITLLPPTCQDELVNVTFGDGPLGLILKRKEGVVFIENIQDGTQACHLDVQKNDELWSLCDQQQIGGGEPLTKARWDELVSLMRDMRPLSLRLRRRHQREQQHAGAQTIAQTHETALQQPQLLQQLPQEPQQLQQQQQQQETEDAALRLLAQKIAFKERSSSLSFLRPYSPSGENSAENATSSSGNNGGSPTQGGNSSGSTTASTPSSSSNNNNNGSVLDFLVKGGRRLVKEGELALLVKGSLWNAAQKRYFFLFNDILLITTNVVSSRSDGIKYIIDTTVDLMSAKVYSHGQGFHGENSANSSQNTFELQSMNGTIQVHAADAQEREVWVLAIYLSICELIRGQEEEQACGWKHQILLGTMHSAVIKGDLQCVRELIHAAETGDLDYQAIEAADEDNLTPLHYACIMRQYEAVRLLHGANADVTIGDSDGKSPIHWAALQLDDNSLGLLLTNVFDADFLDKLDRTPLFLACVEGRDVTGKSNASLLKNCLRSLLALNADPGGLVTSSFMPHQYLASSNGFHDALELLLDAGAHVNYLHNSLSALHLAAIAKPIKPAQGEGVKFLNPGLRRDVLEFESSTTNANVGTIRVLLKYGARPNFKNKDGKAALHLVADNAVNWGGKNCSEVVSLLLAYGARMDDSAQSAVLRSICVDKVNFEALTERWANMAPANADAVGLGANGLVSKMEPPPLPSTPLCELCCSAFTLFRRQHHCRMCASLTCDDCSKRRATAGGAVVRCCDSCFNIILNRNERLPKSPVNTARPLSPSSLTSSGADKHASDKGSLFVGSSTLTTDSSKLAGGGGASLGAIKATIEEVGERLKERGQKLEKLSDKSADLSNAAGDFARLAKQLNENQRSGFW